MTLGDPEWPFHTSRAISAVAEFVTLRAGEAAKQGYYPTSISAPVRVMGVND